MSTADLVVSPLAKGLFRRAILQSGHCSMTRSIPTTRKIALKLAKKMGVAPTREGFMSRTIEQAIAALEWVQKPTSGPRPARRNGQGAGVRRQQIRAGARRRRPAGPASGSVEGRGRAPMSTCCWDRTPRR
jgi:hypothetical protein